MSAVRQAMVLKLDAGDPVTKKMIEKLGENCKEPQRHLKEFVTSFLFATLPCDKTKLRMTSNEGTKACCICTTYFFVGVLWLSGGFLQKSDRPEVRFRCLCSIWNKRGHTEPLTFRAKIHALNTIKY